MQKITIDDFVTMPWKNGMGSTTQLSVYPPGAGLADFQWRVSTAEIVTAGPFSQFAGYDRSIAILEGNGMALELDSLHTAILTPDDMPFPFRGEQQAHASLLSGPITDLNVISRRTDWSHTLEKIQFSGTQQCAMQADLIFIYNPRVAAIHCRTPDGRELDCGIGEAVLIDGTDGSHVDLSAATMATVYIARLTAKDDDNTR